MFRRLSLALILAATIVIAGCIGGSNGGGSAGGTTGGSSSARDRATVHNYLEMVQTTQELDTLLEYLTDRFDAELIFTFNGMPICELVEEPEEPCYDVLTFQLTHDQLRRYYEIFYGEEYIEIDDNEILFDPSIIMVKASLEEAAKDENVGDYTFSIPDIRVRGNTAETRQSFVVFDVKFEINDSVPLIVDLYGTYETYWRRDSNDWRMYKLRVTLDYRYEE